MCIDGKWKQRNDSVCLCRYEYWLLITLRLACHVIELDAIKMPKMKRMKKKTQKQENWTTFFFVCPRKQSMKSQRKCDALLTGVTKTQTIPNMKRPSNMDFNIVPHISFIDWKKYLEMFQHEARSRKITLETNILLWDMKQSLNRVREREKEEQKKFLSIGAILYWNVIFITHFNFIVFWRLQFFLYLVVFYAIKEVLIRLYAYYCYLVFVHLIKFLIENVNVKQNHWELFVWNEVLTEKTSEWKMSTKKRTTWMSVFPSNVVGFNPHMILC